MESDLTKGEMLTLIRREREALDAAVQSLREEQPLRPVQAQGWTGKDIMAHVVAWEQNLIAWTEALLRGETPDRPAPDESWDDLDAYNEALYRRHKDEPLGDVLERFQRSHREVYTLVEGLSEEELLDAEHFAWRKGDPLWHMVAANTWWHYKEHRESIETQFG
jgi:hypothetical protein